MQTSRPLADVLSDWASGKITLKEIEGFSDEELYAIAHMGYFLMMQGKTEEARVIFEGLIAIDPRSDYYYRALGVIFQKIGDNDRAIKQFGYAIRINPDSAQAYINRAEIYLSMQQYVQAQADLRQALQKAGSRDQPLSKKAWALYQVVMSHMVVKN